MHVTDEEVHRQVAANFFSRRTLAAFSGQHDHVCPSPSRSFARTTRSFENIRERKEVTFTEFTTPNSPRLPPRSFHGAGTQAFEQPRQQPSQFLHRHPAPQLTFGGRCNATVCAYKCCGFVSLGSGNPGRAADSRSLRSTSAGQRHAKTSPASQQHQKNCAVGPSPGCCRYETKRRELGGALPELLHPRCLLRLPGRMREAAQRASHSHRRFPESAVVQD